MHLNSIVSPFVRLLLHFTFNDRTTPAQKQRGKGDEIKEFS
jgi:hypothetical protein